MRDYLKPTKTATEEHFGLLVAFGIIASILYCMCISWCFYKCYTKGICGGLVQDAAFIMEESGAPNAPRAPAAQNAPISTETIV